jgi:hypothetical protein
LDHGLRAVFNVRIWPVAAEGDLGAPLTLFVLVFDGLCVPGLALLGGGTSRGVEGLRMRGKALREGTVDRVGPPVFVANDLLSSRQWVA